MDFPLPSVKRGGYVPALSSSTPRWSRARAREADVVEPLFHTPPRRGAPHHTGVCTGRRPRRHPHHQSPPLPRQALARWIPSDKRALLLLLLPPSSAHAHAQRHTASHTHRIGEDDDDMSTKNKQISVTTFCIYK